MGKWQQHQIDYLKKHLWTDGYIEISKVIDKSVKQITYYVHSHNLRDNIPKPVIEKPVKPKHVITEQERNKLRFLFGYLDSRDYNSF